MTSDSEVSGEAMNEHELMELLLVTREDLCKVRVQAEARESFAAQQRLQMMQLFLVTREELRKDMRRLEAKLDTGSQDPGCFLVPEARESFAPQLSKEHMERA